MSINKTKTEKFKREIFSTRSLIEPHNYVELPSANHELNASATLIFRFFFSASKWIIR